MKIVKHSIDNDMQNKIIDGCEIISILIGLIEEDRVSLDGFNFEKYSIGSASKLTSPDDLNLEAKSCIRGLDSIVESNDCEKLIERAGAGFKLDVSMFRIPLRIEIVNKLLNYLNIPTESIKTERKMFGLHYIDSKGNHFTPSIYGFEILEAPIIAFQRDLKRINDVECEWDDEWNYMISTHSKQKVILEPNVRSLLKSRGYKYIAIDSNMNSARVFKNKVLIGGDECHEGFTWPFEGSDSIEDFVGPLDFKSIVGDQKHIEIWQLSFTKL